MWWKVLATIGAVAVIAALALPMATLRIKVDLPPAKPVPAPPACKSIELWMTEGADGVRLSLNGAPTSRDKLLLDMAKAHDCEAAATPVVIRTDAKIKYGEFIALIDQLQGSGYAKFRLVTEGPRKPSSSPGA